MKTVVILFKVHDNKNGYPEQLADTVYTDFDTAMKANSDIQWHQNGDGYVGVTNERLFKIWTIVKAVVNDASTDIRIGMSGDDE